MKYQAVLFDLDGTLLDIDMDIFLQHYFKEMVTLARIRNLPYQELPQIVTEAVQAMIENREADKFNQEIFDLHFLPRYAVDEVVVRQFFQDFYDQHFPRLSSHCAPFSAIPEIMETVFTKGLKVVVATNSLFPLSAIKQRLSWAGVGNYPYDLITTYENMHFTKPHLEYYQEICDYIQVDPKDCLLVGNDVGEDIVASRLGMKTFLLTERVIPAKTEIIIPDYQGSISDLYTLIRTL